MDPLVFDSYCRPQVWGGRRLAELGKALPGGTYGEAWEISAHPHHQSRVIEGPLRGATLAQLWSDHARELYGSHRAPPARFPLLVKFLDCHELLSVQVHPTDDLARAALGRRVGQDRSLGHLGCGADGPDLRRAEARCDARGSGRPSGRRNRGRMFALLRAPARRLLVPAGRHRPRGGRRRAHGRGATVERCDVSPVRLESAGARRTPAAIARRAGAGIDRLECRSGQPDRARAATCFATWRHGRRAGALSVLRAGAAIGRRPPSGSRWPASFRSGWCSRGRRTYRAKRRVTAARFSVARRC